MEDKNFAERLNILRAGVLGANDGIISIAGVVIGVASATSNIWFILISALSAIFAGAFSMAGGEYVSVSTQKDTEEAAIAKEQALLDRSPEAARESLYRTFLSQGDCETAAAISSFFAFSVGSLPPALAIMLFPEPYRIPVTVVVVALTLLLTGYISAKLGKAPIKQAMLRNLTVGLLTMLVTFLVGHIFHVNV